MITDYLGVKNSTRNLSDEEFDNILPQLALELSQVNIVKEYNNYELIKDWDKLCMWIPDNNYINSTSRIGMKLCEHFFPNFYEIKDHKNRSFYDIWSNTDILEKILRWNRKSHTTPYLSELKRGVYFCGGLAKSTMYRPQMAKMVTLNHSKVLDPCCGWGGRMLGSVSSGCDYYGFEPNTKTYNNLIKLSEFLGISDKVHIYCDDALNMNNYNIPQVDCILTSPPYFNLEVYCDESTQSVNNISTYKQWVDHFLHPLVKLCTHKMSDTGVSYWNVAKIKQGDMWEDIKTIHHKLGFTQLFEYMVRSSKRQVNGKGKSNDLTLGYAS